MCKVLHHKSVFVTVSHIQCNLIFEGKASANPSRAPLRTPLKGCSPSLARKSKARVKVTDNDKLNAKNYSKKFLRGPIFTGKSIILYYILILYLYSVLYYILYYSSL